MLDLKQIVKGKWSKMGCVLNIYCEIYCEIAVCDNIFQLVVKSTLLNKKIVHSSEKSTHIFHGC